MSSMSILSPLSPISTLSTMSAAAHGDCDARSVQKNADTPEARAQHPDADRCIRRPPPSAGSGHVAQQAAHGDDDQPQESDPKR